MEKNSKTPFQCCWTVVAGNRYKAVSCAHMSLFSTRLQRVLPARELDSQEGKISYSHFLPRKENFPKETGFLLPMGLFTNCSFLLVIYLYRIRDISEYNENIFFFHSPVVIIICGSTKLSRLI